MKLCEILMSDDDDAKHGWREWLAIYKEDDRISFRHEYTSPRDPGPERKTWHDQGSGFYLKDLDTVIAALQSARDRSVEPK